MTNKVCRSMLHWSSILCTKGDVDLNTLLSCGQSFTWKQTGKNIWTNVLNGKIYSITQTDTQLYWCASTTSYELPDLPRVAEKSELKFDHKEAAASQLCNSEGKDLIIKQDGLHVKTEPIRRADVKYTLETVKAGNEVETVIWDYFALDVDVKSLYTHWSKRDSHFSKIAESFGGIRILRQDPTENLFAFICSSNNHVSRIASMVNKLAEHFGNYLGTVNGQDFYSFPSPEKLASPDVEAKLRQLGFGYRAKFIVKTASVLHNDRPDGWLETLKSVPYSQCVEELMKLCGVGRKVADCVALMSLNKTHVVPVDTHVLQIAVRDYRIPGVGRDVKSMTPALHDKISEFFVNLYGEYAGWAHTVLFAADLRRFSDGSEPLKPKSKVRHQKPALLEVPKTSKKPKIVISESTIAPTTGQRRSRRLQT